MMLFLPTNVAPSFSQALLTWYDQQGRKDLPWRQYISPYRVWVSEIMLQQTQVKTVIPYFLNLIEFFPTIADLAAAKEDLLLHLWSGLGYYSRARNMHKTAQAIIQEHAGQFPKTLPELQALPGIGRSTAGAILAISMNQPVAILDGNVKRILCRYHTIPGLPAQAKVTEQLWHWAQWHTPKERAADYTQAIMDLGAIICTRHQPKCSICPLNIGCQAYLENRVNEFPEKNIRKKQPLVEIKMFIFHNKQNNTVLLEKRPPTGVWGGLWSLPESQEEENSSVLAQKYPGCKVLNAINLASFRHIFTHFKLRVTPVYIDHFHWPDRVMDSAQTIWYNLAAPERIGLARPVQELLKRLP